jgi:hypothetical protein
MALATAGAAALAFRATAATSAGDVFLLKSIALYLPEKELVERGMTAAALAGYIKRLVSEANEVLGPAPRAPGASGALVVALKPPARSRLWVMEGDKTREAEFTSALKGRLEAVPPPPVLGVYAFAINFDVWGGGTPLRVSFLPIPDEWARVMTGKKQYLLPDDPLSVIWPD